MSNAKIQRLNEVRDYLLALIDDGRIPPGSRLPTERELGAQFALSRNTIRKVLDTLESDGRIKRHVGRGTFVWDEAASRLAPQKSMDKPLRAADVIEFRLLFEPEFAELAVTKTSRNDLRRIDRALAEAENATTSDLYNRKSFALHLAIAEATRNPVLIEIYRGIGPTICSLTPESHKGHQEVHEQIVRAIANGEADRTRALMTSHLLELRQELVGY